MDGPAPTPTDDSERASIEAHAGADRIALIASSFHRVTGRPLLAGGGSLWSAPMVILAHGTQDDPIFFYANRMALALFETCAHDVVRMPSRYSAEAMERAERARFLDAVGARNFIADYAGVRISQRGARFRIEQAVVWNLLDGDGAIHGQAACFDRWTALD